MKSVWAHDAVSEELQRRFDRMELHLSNGEVSFRGAAAMFAYCWMYREYPHLARIGRTIGEAPAHHRLESARADEVAARERLAEALVEIIPARLLDAEVDGFGFPSPLIDFIDLRDEYMGVALAACDVALVGEDRLLAAVRAAVEESGMNKAREAVKRLERAELVLDYALPARGWKIVERLSRTDEIIADPKLTTDYYHTEWLRNALGAGDSRVQLPSSLHQVLAHVEVMHGRVLMELRAGELAWNAVQRFKERVERFELVDIRRRQLTWDSDGGRADEDFFRDSLCAYLHDRGFEPYSEVNLGAQRSDLVAFHEHPAPFEIKVVRNKGGVRSARTAVKSAVRQAASYARATRSQCGYAVVVWRADEIGRQVPDSADLGDVVVRLVFVDLVQRPSSVVPKGTLTIDTFCEV